MQVFLFLYILANTCYFLCSWFFSHFNRYDVISHCGFHLFPSWLVILSIFSCVSWQSVCPLWKNCLLRSLPILNWIVWGCFWCWVVWILYVFWILIPYWIYHLPNIFSHSVNCLFCFVDGVLCYAKKKKKSVNVVPVLYFYFCFPCLRRPIQK